MCIGLLRLLLGHHRGGDANTHVATAAYAKFAWAVHRGTLVGTLSRLGHILASEFMHDLHRY